MSKVRWGVISTAKIGVDQVIPAMQQGQFSEMVAISSRSLHQAQAAASDLGLAKAYGSYDELLDDPEIDAVYNPLPNHMHLEWSVKALEAGKHVLCEKPIGMSTAEAEHLAAAADEHPQLKVMEAFMYRHHPQWRRAKQIVDGGGVGELRTIQSFFSYFNNDPDNVRNQLDAGGGALLDIGCYCISLARFLFDAEPNRVWGTLERDPSFKTDRISSGVLEFDRGSSAFTCGTQLTRYQRMNAMGTDGRVEIEIPFNAPSDRPCRIWHQRGHEVEEILLDTCNQYTAQGDLFSRAVLDDTPVPTPLSDAIANMRVIDACFASAQREQWVSIDSGAGRR